MVAVELDTNPPDGEAPSPAANCDRPARRYVATEMGKTMNRKHWVAMAAVGALAVTGAAGASAAVTSAVAADGTIDGCYRVAAAGVDDGQQGQLRVLAADQQCKKNELAIQWNQKGLKGDVGAQGAAGQPGTKGEAGATGATGLLGQQGIQGLSGLQGLKGDQGADGTNGARGADGEAGAAGAAGPTGPVGPAGSAGPVGPVGPAGQGGPTTTAVFAGLIATIPGWAQSYVFAGPPATIVVTAGQKLVGAAALTLRPAPVGAGTAAFFLGLCYQQGNGPIRALGVTNYVIVSANEVRTSQAAVGFGAPDPGTYSVGACIYNAGSVALDSNYTVNGWVMATG